VNQAAVDMLRKLPGVTEANYRQLMAAAGSLAGLADMALEALEAATGSSRAAKALRVFLDAPCPRL
jgi:DNA excision repair protein ERCC-4